MPALSGSTPHSIETRKALAGSTPHSIERRRALSAASPHSTRTDNILSGATPHSFQTTRNLASSTPHSTRTGETVPAEARAGGVDSRVQLRTPNGLLPVSSWQVTEAISHGWDWSVELPYWVDDAFEYGETDYFEIIGQDGLGSKLRTPPLVARPRYQGADSNGETARFSGVDVGTYKLSKDGVSFPTFRNSNTAAMAAAVGAEVGVAIIGMPTITVLEEDIKQAKAADILTRFLSWAAYDYKIDLQGNVLCFPFQSTGENYRVKPSSIEREGNPLDRINKYHFSKTSSLRDRQLFRWDSVGYKIEPLQNPMNGVFVRDVSTIGFLTQIGVWEGDPTKGGKLISYFHVSDGAGLVLPTPVNGSGPATHISCYVNGSAMSPNVISAALQVRGTPPGSIPAGVELAFEQDWNPGGQGRDGGVLAENGYPNAAWVLSRAQLYAWQAGRDLDVIRMEGALDFSFALADAIDAKTELVIGQPRTWPRARVESITHAGSAGQIPSTNLIAMVIPW